METGVRQKLNFRTFVITLFVRRWNDLEEFLGKVDYDVEPERTTTRETSSHLAKFRFYSDYEQFQIGLGKIMLTAVKKDENSEQSFHNAVQKVKIEVRLPKENSQLQLKCLNIFRLFIYCRLLPWNLIVELILYYFVCIC